VRYSELFMNALQLNSHVAVKVTAVATRRCKVDRKIQTMKRGAVSAIATKQMTSTFLAERIAFSVTSRELPVTTDCCCAVIRL